MLSFLVLTFSWSWGFGWGASQVSPLNSVGRSAMIIASGYGPSLAGFAVVGMFSKATGFREWLARCFNTRLAWRWFAMAFLAPPAVMLLALAILALAGGQVQPILAFDYIPLVIANFGLVLLIGGPLGEEFGWRGYAMSALGGRMNWRAASLIIGLIWGLWHLPLFFMVGTAQSKMPIAVFMLNILAGSVLFGWLFEQTDRSVLPAIVLHTSLNSFAGILAIVPTAASGQAYSIVTGLLVAIAAGLLIAPIARPAQSSC